MSNYPEGANEDKNAPWHNKELRTKECPECNGAGTFHDSDCCCAPIHMGDICTNCGEHCSEAVCDICEGSGKITMTAEDIENEQIDAEIQNGEMFDDKG